MMFLLSVTNMFQYGFEKLLQKYEKQQKKQKRK